MPLPEIPPAGRCRPSGGMGRSKGWASVDEDGNKVRADSDVDLVRALLRQRAARDDARVVERLMHLICTDTDRHFHVVLRSSCQSDQACRGPVTGMCESAEISCDGVVLPHRGLVRGQQHCVVIFLDQGPAS